jgi:hypothetical protein
MSRWKELRQGGEKIEITEYVVALQEVAAVNER